MSSYRLLISSILLAACSTDPQVDESAGTTTVGESTSESGTESETGEDQGLCGGWSMTIDLVGAMSMPEDCDNFVFTGSNLEQTVPGTWQLDSCACEAACESPDPYTFTMTFSGESTPAFPTLPTCPQIELYRDEQCNIAAVVVRDLDSESAPVWWATNLAEVVPGLEWLLSQLIDEQLCTDGDDDGPAVSGQAIRFAVDMDSIDLVPGESGTLASTPVGPIEIHHGNDTTLNGDGIDSYPSNLIVVQP